MTDSRRQPIFPFDVYSVMVPAQERCDSPSPVTLALMPLPSLCRGLYLAGARGTNHLSQPLCKYAGVHTSAHTHNNATCMHTHTHIFKPDTHTLENVPQRSSFHTAFHTLRLALFLYRRRPTFHNESSWDSIPSSTASLAMSTTSDEKRPPLEKR